MSIPLYLTAEERAVFEKLPAKTREGGAVAEETLNAYETEKQLKIRRDIFRKKDPEFMKLTERLEAAQKEPSMEAFARKMPSPSRELLFTILFTMGAGYLRDWIRMLLPTMVTHEDVTVLAELTHIRHLLLETNAEPVS